MNQSSWDRRYAGADHPGCSAPAQALTSRLATLPPGHAIDLACGLGRHARFLADSGCSVEAVDFSPVAIEVAKAAHEGGQIDYTVGDVRTWKPVQPADLVVIGYLHLPIDELVEVITSAGTWLRPGGHLLYLGHSLENSMFGVGGLPIEPFCPTSPIWRGRPVACGFSNLPTSSTAGAFGGRSTSFSMRFHGGFTRTGRSPVERPDGLAVACGRAGQELGPDRLDVRDSRP
jgi:SAM-dependent methyltransferase